MASVASVFVSRIDTAVDNQLEFRIRRSEDENEKAILSGLLGKTASANAKMQYQRFKTIFSSERFAKLKAKGARAQRPLWASTGTKNPNCLPAMLSSTITSTPIMNAAATQAAAS